MYLSYLLIKIIIILILIRYYHNLKRNGIFKMRVFIINFHENFNFYLYFHVLLLILGKKLLIKSREIIYSTFG